MYACVCLLHIFLSVFHVSFFFFYVCVSLCLLNACLLNLVLCVRVCVVLFVYLCVCLLSVLCDCV